MTMPRRIQLTISITKVSAAFLSLPARSRAKGAVLPYVQGHLTTSVCSKSCDQTLPARPLPVVSEG